MKRIFKLRELDCANCAAKMQTAIEKIDGVDACSVNFMTQRLKPVPATDPGYADYIARLTTLHALLVEAMKAKQGSDPATADRLQALANAFDKLYFHHEKEK